VAFPLPMDSNSAADRPKIAAPMPLSIDPQAP
jgi:hypothetical protein